MDQPDRLKEALASEADGLMLDLTDLVAVHQKGVARDHLRGFLSQECAKHVWVRIAEADENDALAADLDASVSDHVAGLIIPECVYPGHVTKIAHMLDLVETQRGLEAGSIRLLPLPESALAIRNYYDTLTASPRVSAAWFPGAPRGDLCRDVGYEWSSEGTERLYMRSKVVVDARAAGIEHIIDSGPGQVLDPVSFEADVRTSLRFGYTGRLAYNAEQAEIVNRVFTPRPEDVAAAEEEIEAYKKALGLGHGLFELGGRIVDVTTVKHAMRVVERAAAAKTAATQADEDS